MVDSINGLSNTTTTTDTASNKKGATGLDREAFLKLLVAQMSHQDPLAPTEGTEYIAQLSQFAIVEQSVAQSSKLDMLSAQMGGLANGQATALVGKTVDLRGHGIAWDGTSATGAGATLGSPATKVTVDIVDAQGKTIRTLELGARPAGPFGIAWDGKDQNGQPVPPGNYNVKINATGADGKPVDVSQNVKGTVTAVTFEKGYPELRLDSGASAPLSDLVSVGGVVK